MKPWIPAPTSKDPDLHATLMNLPCKTDLEVLEIFDEMGIDLPKGGPLRENLMILAYKIGHRDARHAAAEAAESQNP